MQETGGKDSMPKKARKKLKSQAKKKLQPGGLLTGPSHEEGGIPVIVDGTELIEVEGEEIIINDSINEAASMHEEGLLALNENPEDFMIVPIDNAPDRRKK